MIRLVHLLVGALALAPAAVVGQPNAQQPAPAAPPAMAASPHPAVALVEVTRASSFVPLAASANLFEIESSQLALQRSHAAPVKDFANRIVTDHDLAAAKLAQALSDANIPAPTPTLNGKDRTALDNLKIAKGATFNKAYIEAQYNAHLETVNLFDAYTKNGDNPRLKALAADLLPTLQGHLDHIARLRSAASPQPVTAPATRPRTM
jgi:putative membrane protein